MKKREVVRSNYIFNDIINKGNKVSNSFYTLFFVNNDNSNVLFGISAPKKIGNAVLRNKVKRQTRALVDNNKMLFKNGRNYIIIIKEKFLGSSFEQKNNELKNIIGEANEKE